MVEFKHVKNGATITADSFDELKEFKAKFDKGFPEHKYTFSDYYKRNGKHIATFYLNRIDKDGKPIAMI